MTQSEQIQSLRRELKEARAEARALRARIVEMVRLKMRGDAKVLKEMDRLHRRAERLQERLHKRAK
jgi:hypothetical protein